jgi:hypothetical protein
MMGGIPSRPSGDLSSLHGLDDNIWNCMENCWRKDPTARPTTTDLVLRFQLVLNGAVDQRPPDKFNTHSPSQALHSGVEHPFSILSPQEEDDATLRALKGVPADGDIIQPSFSNFGYHVHDGFTDDLELADRTFLAQAKQQEYYVSSGEVPLRKDKDVHPLSPPTL